MNEIMNNQQLNTLTDELNQINSQAQQMTMKAFQKVLKDNNESLKKEILENINDKLIKNDRGNKNTLIQIEKEIKETKNDVVDLKDKTEVIEWEKHLMKELQDTVRKRCHKLTGSKHTATYKLFYGAYSSSCNKHIKTIFNVNSVGKIKVDDITTALHAVRNWYPTQKIVDNRLRILVKEQENSHLSKEKSKMLDDYLSN